jgi:predicted DNA-binding protein YlxM (UPF0122 family)|tara:strand:+ start:5131 stop:5460 length:330 start_codon:yes stop_codon:yes gene_type:complete
MAVYNKKNFLRRSKYFEIFMLTLNTDLTLEEIGIKFGVTKQRVWQIVRFNNLGGGDYYKGYTMYNNKYKTLLYNAKLDTIKRKQLMRDWLKKRNVRLIRSKSDDTKISS